jgi:hypothetical protein
MEPHHNSSSQEQRIDALERQLADLARQVEELKSQVRAPEQIAADLAGQIALGEMVRFVIGEIAFDQDADTAKKKLQLAEQSLIASLNSRRIFPNANDFTETTIKELASGYITKMITSIRHPDDEPRPTRQQ